MTILITLTTVGIDCSTFDIYSNVDGFLSAFETDVPKNSLLTGFSSANVPDGTTVIRVKAKGVCTNYMASDSNYGNDGNYVLGGVTTPAPTVGLTSNNQTGITVATTVTNVGGGLGHNNVQPSIGCYYIMYIPS